MLNQTGVRGNGSKARISERNKPWKEKTQVMVVCVRVNTG